MSGGRLSPLQRRLVVLLVPLGLCACLFMLAGGYLILSVENFRIEGTAMEPTFHNGQYLLVDTFAYGGSGAPQRGDIVVFEAWTPGKDYIKRVVGLPGETVEVHDDAVWIDGERLEEPYLDWITPGPDQPVHLGDDEYFVLGDNRGNSSDSRNHGALKGDQIIGRVWFTYWPPGQIGFER